MTGDLGSILDQLGGRDEAIAAVGAWVNGHSSLPPAWSFAAPELEALAASVGPGEAAPDLPKMLERVVPRLRRTLAHSLADAVDLDVLEHEAGERIREHLALAELRVRLQRVAGAVSLLGERGRGEGWTSQDVAEALSLARGTG